MGFGAHPGYAVDCSTDAPARKAIDFILPLVASNAVPMLDREEQRIVAILSSTEIDAKLEDVSTREGIACENFKGPCGSESSMARSLLADNFVKALLSSSDDDYLL